MCKLNIIVNTSYKRDDIERYLSLKPKRPRRAVRACLQCQARKIKCTGRSPCESCKARKVDCVYNDKALKQQFDNKIANTSSLSSTHSHSHSHSPGLDRLDPLCKTRLSRTSQLHSISNAHSHAARSSQSSHSRYLGPTAVPVSGGKLTTSFNNSSGAQSKPSLARPASPPIKITSLGTEAVPGNWPDYTYTHHNDILDSSSDFPELPERSFIARFYTLMGSYLPYMDPETLGQKLHRGPLSRSLLYSMAALVSRMDAVAGESSGNGGNSGGSRSSRAALYTKASKGLVFPYISTPRLDVVYTLVLIAYNEFAEARDSALWTWSGMAIRMCYDLGLSNLPDAKDDQVLYKHVFGSVICLDRIVSLSMGRKTAIPDQDLTALAWLDDKLLPSPPNTPSVEIHDPFHHLCHLMTIAGLMSNFINSSQYQDQANHDSKSMATYLNALTEFHTNLSSELYFDIHNFQQARKRKQSQAFLIIHVWHQALLIMVHCRLWNRNYSPQDAPSPTQPNPGLSQLQCDTASQCISNIGDMISLADLIDPSSYLASPFLAQPLYLAACTAVNLSKVQTHTPYLEYSIRKAYGTCRSALTRMQTIWLGISSHLTSLDGLQSTLSAGSADNVAVQGSNFPHDAHADELAPESPFLGPPSTGGGQDVTASTISPFSMNSTSSRDYSHTNGLLPWGEVVESTSTKGTEWDPDMLLWGEMTDWDITSNTFPPCGMQMVTPMMTAPETLPWDSPNWVQPANVRHRQQERPIRRNTVDNASLTDVIDQSFHALRPEAVVESDPHAGFWMGEIDGQNI